MGKAFYFVLLGMLEMGKCFLPVSKRWNQYIRQSEDMCSEIAEESERVLGALAKETCQLGMDDQYLEDFWMWDEDWSATAIRIRKRSSSKRQDERPTSESADLDEKFHGLLESSEALYKKQPPHPGYPKWYQDVGDKPGPIWSSSVTGLTASKKIVPKLLRLSWMGYPLYRDANDKWGYIVPCQNSSAASAASEPHSDSPPFPTEKLKSAIRRGAERQESDSLDISDVNLEPRDYVKPLHGKKRSTVNDTNNGKQLPNLPGCRFFRLPHKDGKDNNVGNPLAKDFIDKIQNGTLATRSGDLANNVLIAGKLTSYWISNRDRIINQMVVSNGLFDVILPQLVAAGTLTRRAVERTWLTASNAKKDRIGSELKTLVEAPEGYHLVGADVDSQELWIAAVLGDAHFAGEHGCTPLGWMTLQGNKGEGTDMHSLTAKTVGVSRDDAKILNYGRIYGAGLNFARQLLMRFNPLLSEQEAKRLANEMYLQTKGNKLYVLSKMGAFCYCGTMFNSARHNENWQEYVGEIVGKAELSKIVKFKRKLDQMFKPARSPSSGLNEWVPLPSTESLVLELGINIGEKDTMRTKQVYEVLAEIQPGFGSSSKDDAQTWPDAVSEVCSRTRWTCGTESHSFNRLEDIALDWNAKTPVLGCRITRVLESKSVGTSFMPSRINWVVQSSAVDYLHLLLVAMKWLIQEYDIQGRFVISIHDEVRYIVKDEDCLRAALALQIANLLVRAMFCSRLGMKNLPADVAYFSTVDVDKVMRKDPMSECQTPSNPRGMLHGHGIPTGQALTVDDLVERLAVTLDKDPPSSEASMLSLKNGE